MKDLVVLVADKNIQATLRGAPGETLSIGDQADHI